MTALLAIEGLSVSYGRIAAVRDANVRLEAGEIVTIIGANGAGKTSLLKAVMGLLPSQGALAFDGTPLGGLDVEERVERGLLLVPETRELFVDMPVADNLLLGAYHYRRRKPEIAQELEKVYALFPRLHERRSQRAGTLSGGERQMLALGRALMGRPKVLMLDEPSLGLAPLIVREIFAIILRLKALGVATLLVEQNARAALETADRAYVLETGDIVRQGAAADLLADPRLAELYLGGDIDEPANEG